MTFLTYQLCHVFSSVNLPRIPPRLHRSCQCSSALSGGNQHAVASRSAQRHNGIEKANLELDHDANCSGPAATNMQFAYETMLKRQTRVKGEVRRRMTINNVEKRIMIGKSSVKLMAMDFIIPHPSSRGDGRSSRRTKRSFTQKAEETRDIEESVSSPRWLPCFTIHHLTYSHWPLPSLQLGLRVQMDVLPHWFSCLRW